MILIARRSALKPDFQELIIGFKCYSNSHCAPQTIVDIIIFSQKSLKKQKSKKFEENFCKKTVFFKFALKRCMVNSCASISKNQKNSFLGIKPSTSLLVQTKQNVFFLDFAANLLLFCGFLALYADRNIQQTFY